MRSCASLNNCFLLQGIIDSVFTNHIRILGFKRLRRCFKVNSINNQDFDHSTINHSKILAFTEIYLNQEILTSVRVFSSCSFKHNHPTELSLSILCMAAPIFEELLCSRELESISLDDELTIALTKALDLTLTGKLLATTRISLSNVTFYASRSWDCKDRLSAFKHGGGLYTFEFILASNVDHVFFGGPWFIEGNLLLVHKMYPNISISHMIFEHSKVWVRIFNLPPKGFSKKFAKAIRNSLDNFCEANFPDSNVGAVVISKLPTVRKYLRVKVTIDLQVPLKRSQTLKIRNPASNIVEDIVVRFAYERLSFFCYICGLIGPEVAKCESQGPLIYTDSIRAERHYQNTKKAKTKASGNGESEGVSKAPSEHKAESSKNPAKNLVSASLASPRITPESGIILADCRSIREAGPLPPVPQNSPFFDVQCLPIPIAESANAVEITGGVSTPVNNLPQPVTTQSILGAAPTALRPPLHPQSKKVTPPKSVPDSTISYFNPSIPSEELFSINDEAPAERKGKSKDKRVAVPDSWDDSPKPKRGRSALGSKKA